MTTSYRVRALALGLVATVMLAACGADTPQARLEAAKGYLAKNESKAAIIELKNALGQDPNLAEARYLLGKALLDGGDPVGAEVELRKAGELRYDAGQVTPLLAQTLLAAGQAKKVVAEMAGLQLTDATAQASLQTSLAIAHATLGQLDKARELVAQALKTKPEHDAAMVAQARLKLVDRDIDGAMAALDTAVSKNPGNHEAWTLKGNLLDAQGKTEPARSAYRKALEQKVNYAPAHAALVMGYLRQDNMEAAGKQVEAMKKALPKNLQTSYVEALFAYQKKDFAHARDLVMDIQKYVRDDPRLLLLAGAIHLKLNSYQQAESLLTKAQQLKPNAAAPRQMLAELYLRSGQPAKALGLIEPVLERNRDPRLMALAGTAYLQSGDAQKANDYFNRASSLEPENKLVQVNAAVSQMAMGQKDAGFATLEHIAAGDKETTADMVLIAAAIRQKDFDKALRAIDNLEKKQPGSPVPTALRGTAMASKGDLAAARKHFEKALSIKPTYLPAVASLATLDLAERKPAEAKRRFEALLKADANNGAALLALAELEAGTGGAASRVAELLARAVKADPQNVKAQLASINYSLNSKNAKAALETAQKAVAALPDRPQLLDALARAQLASGEANQALATYGKVLTLMPNSPPAQMRMAELQLAAKQKEAAVQSLKKALAIKSDYLPAQRGLVIVYLADGHHEDALAVARTVQKQRPKEGIGHLLEGDIFTTRKEWAQAAATYRAGLKKQPMTEMALKLHGALVRAGQAAEAGKFENSWLLAHPNDIAFARYAAQYAMQRGDYGVAVRYYKDMLHRQPNDVVAINNLASALAQTNDPKAIDYAEQAYRLAPRQPAVMDTLAMLAAKKGDTQRALGLLQEAYKLAPNVPIIRFNLAKVLIQAGKRSEATPHLKDLEKLGDKFPGQAEVKKLLANGLK